MPENIDYYNTEDEEIDLKGLFFYVCKQWRALLLFLLIGAIAGCLISFVKMNESGEQAAAAAEIKLAPNREAVANEYAEYLTLLEQAAARADDSVILNMDPTAVYTGELSYFVSCKSEDIDEIEALADTFLSRDGNWDKLHKASGLDCSLGAFKELVTVDFTKVGATIPVGVNTVMVVPGAADQSEAVGETGSGYLSVTVKAPEEDNAQAVLAEAGSIIENVLKQYSKEYDALSFMQLKNEITQGFNNDVSEAQRGYANIKKGYVDVINAYGKDLTDEEKAYLEYQNKDEETEIAAVEAPKKDFSKKWPVIGAVVLFFIGAVWYAFKYLINDQIKNEEDFGSLYGLKVLGSIRVTESGKTGLDRWLDELDSSRSVEPVSEEYLSALIQGLESESVALVEATGNETEKETAGRLAAGNSKLIDAGCMLNDNNAVNKVMDCGGIVIIAKMESIRHPEMVRMLGLAQKLGKRVLGIVVVI